jgi:hypothetical protein
MSPCAGPMCTGGAVDEEAIAIVGGNMDQKLVRLHGQIELFAKVIHSIFAGGLTRGRDPGGGPFLTQEFRCGRGLDSGTRGARGREDQQTQEAEWIAHGEETGGA